MSWETVDLCVAFLVGVVGLKCTKERRGKFDDALRRGLR